MEATTAKGNTYEAMEYVDPQPGRLGKERVTLDCWACDGGGVYMGPSRVTFYTATSGGEDTGCFHCNGTGKYTPLVSSLRAAERRRVNINNEHRAEEADRDLVAEAAAEQAKIDAAQLMEAARLNRMVQGFVAPVGTRIKDLRVTVKSNYEFETQGYTGGSVMKSILVFFTSTGQELKWVTDARNIGRDEVVILTGTVKSHGNYKGQDQTVMTRCIIK